MTPALIAETWWQRIDAGDYAQAATLLAPGTPVDWPLSGERLASPLAWQRVNEHYPASAAWRATIVRMVVDGEMVVTFTQVTDGRITDLAISEFTVRGGQIVRLVEYWPETYAAPTWRAEWSSPLPYDANPLRSPVED